MSSETFGTVNSYPEVGPIVISEIMYHPDWLTGSLYNNEEFEYIEITNITGSAVPLYENIDGQNIGWRFTEGIDYTFPVGTEISGNGSIVISRNSAAFLARYGVAAFDEYDGKLSNSGEKLELSKPGDRIVEAGQYYYYIRVDRVNYSDGADGGDPWPADADGSGKALVRKVLSDYGNDPDNWQADVP